MPSEINQTEKDKYCMLSLICGSKKHNKLVNTTKKKQIHRYREQSSGCKQGDGKERGNIGVKD